MPIAVTKDTYDQEVMYSGIPVVIDAYASWCGPCQQMAVIIDQVEKEVGAKYKFVKINVDESRELAIQLGVTSIPTFIFLMNGEIKGKEVGYMPKDEFVDKLTEYLG